MAMNPALLGPDLFSGELIPGQTSKLLQEIHIVVWRENTEDREEKFSFPLGKRTEENR